MSISDLWATLGNNLPQVFAGVVVALYAWKRYGTPTRNRSSTTCAQFYFTCCAYVLCALTIYLALTSLLENPEATKFLTFGIQLPEETTSLSTPFVAALFLTTLLPSIPFLCGIDTALLKCFQRLGSIPIEVRRLRHELKEIGYAPTQKTEALVRSYLNAYPKVLTTRLVFGRGKTIQHDFTRILCLYCELKELDEQSGFLSDFVDEEEELKKLVELVCAQATSYFSFAQAKDVAPDALEEATVGFEKVCDAADDKICLLFARGLLSASWSGNKLRQRLSNLGFSVGDHPPFILNTVLTAGIIVFAIFVSGMFLMRAAGQFELNINRQVTLAIVIAVNYGIAATLALTLKRRCAFGKRTRERGRSVLAYLISAALTGMLAMSVGVLHTAFWEGSIAGGLQRYFTVAYPWICPPIIVALLLAFLCDNFALEKSEPRWLRWTEGAIAGVMVAATTLGASIWFRDLLANAPNPTTGVSTIASPAVYTAILISIGIAIGLTLGSLVPYAYRKARRLEDSPSPPQPAPPMLQAVAVNG
jgi:hypothetical protein